MGVYIKGMEMPTSCEKCPCKTVDAFGGLGCQATGYIPLRKVNQNRPDWCPLVPVPTHGRLGDLDAIEKQIDYIANLQWNKDVGASGGMLAALEVVEDAPTIIPANTEEEKMK